MDEYLDTDPMDYSDPLLYEDPTETVDESIVANHTDDLEPGTTGEYSQYDEFRPDTVETAAGPGVDDLPSELSFGPQTGSYGETIDSQREPDVQFGSSVSVYDPNGTDKVTDVNFPGSSSTGTDGHGNHYSMDQMGRVRKTT